MHWMDGRSSKCQWRPTCCPPSRVAPYKKSAFFSPVLFALSLLGDSSLPIRRETRALSRNPTRWRECSFLRHQQQPTGNNCKLLIIDNSRRGSVQMEAEINLFVFFLFFLARVSWLGRWDFPTNKKPKIMEEQQQQRKKEPTINGGRVSSRRSWWDLFRLLAPSLVGSLFNIGWCRK